MRNSAHGLPIIDRAQLVSDVKQLGQRALNKAFVKGILITFKFNLLTHANGYFINMLREIQD
jgi:hypothetical protein